MNAKETTSGKCVKGRESLWTREGKFQDVTIRSASRVGRAIEDGTMSEKRRNKVSMQKDGVEGIFADNGNGKLVLTGYRIKADAKGVSQVVPPELRTSPVPRKEEVVAALRRILPKLGLEKQMPIESRHAVSLMGDPHDLITAIAATRKRSCNHLFVCATRYQIRGFMI